MKDFKDQIDQHIFHNMDVLHNKMEIMTATGLFNKYGLDICKTFIIFCNRN